MNDATCSLDPIWTSNGRPLDGNGQATSDVSDVSILHGLIDISLFTVNGQVASWSVGSSGKTARREGARDER